MSGTDHRGNRVAVCIRAGVVIVYDPADKMGLEFRNIGQKVPGFAKCAVESKLKSGSVIIDQKKLFSLVKDGEHIESRSYLILVNSTDEFKSMAEG